MQQAPWRQIAGIVLVVGGLYLAQTPSVLFTITPETSTFMRISHHVFGGVIIGLGLIILRRQPLKPLKPFLISNFGWLTLGALTGRCLGLWAFEGTAPVHTYLVFAEIGVLIGCSIYIRRQSLPSKDEPTHSL
ncbi:MAG: hypothetical protein ACPGQS_14180 [Bradymonadia bacterium]